MAGGVIPGSLTLRVEQFAPDITTRARQNAVASGMPAFWQTWLLRIFALHLQLGVSGQPIGEPNAEWRDKLGQELIDLLRRAADVLR